MNKDWSPELYLKFDKERIQPSIDLVSKIAFDSPKKIIDIGCGPGNSTQVLVSKWPSAEIIGIDNSPAMIEKARMEYPQQKWELLDAGKDRIDGRFDIVFSNATIQWIPDHSGLLKKFNSMLSDDGLVAVQMPLFWDMPLGKTISQISKEDKWRMMTEGVADLFTIHNTAFYYDHLSELFRSVNIWETSYIHILDSHLSILEMIRSTGLKPFLDRLTDDLDRKTFENSVLNEIKKNYPVSKNGKVLFPFKRLFFIAKK